MALTHMCPFQRELMEFLDMLEKLKQWNCWASNRSAMILAYASATRCPRRRQNIQAPSARTHRAGDRTRAGILHVAPEYAGVHHTRIGQSPICLRGPYAMSGMGLPICSYALFGTDAAYDATRTLRRPVSSYRNSLRRPR
eukprot:2180498-Rhodomonas_salina.1